MNSKVPVIVLGEEDVCLSGREAGGRRQVREDAALILAEVWARWSRWTRAHQCFW